MAVGLPQIWGEAAAAHVCGTLTRTTGRLEEARRLLLATEHRTAQQDWFEFLEEALAGPASFGHAWTKLEDEERLELAVAADGLGSSDPEVLLAAEYEKWGPLWKASAVEPPAMAWPACDMLPPLTHEQLRAAAAAFPTKTSCLDGLHPKALGALPDAGLSVLAGLFEVAECAGNFAQVWHEVVMKMIPKPGGGARPIGLFRGAVRLWAKARRGHA